MKEKPIHCVEMCSVIPQTIEKIPYPQKTTKYVYLFEQQIALLLN